MSDWDAGITTVTLFVEDLGTTKEFYQRAFGLPVHWEDPQSAVFQFGNIQVNLLVEDAAPEVIEPAIVGTGARLLLTLTVDDVDRVHQQLRERGVEFLNGPIDRPWGVRTAAFADPAGHVWELAQ